MTSTYSIPEPLDQWNRKPLGVNVTIDEDERPFYSLLVGHEQLSSRIEAERSQESLDPGLYRRLATLFNWFSDLDDELLGVVVSGWVGRELSVNGDILPPFWWPANMKCPPEWPMMRDDMRCLAAAVVESRSDKQEFDRLKAVAGEQAIFMIGTPTKTFHESLTTILEVAESMHCTISSPLIQGENLLYTEDDWRCAQPRPISDSPATHGTMVLAPSCDTDCPMRNSKAPDSTACQMCRFEYRKYCSPKDVENGYREASVMSGHACNYTDDAVT